MFLSLFIIMFLEVLGGILFEKLKLPKLIWYLILGILIGPSVFRSIGVLICLICTNYNFKEKTFIIISYLPKETVQTSIGAICLNEGLECGTIVLLWALISILLSAPIGAILMDTSYKKLLNKN